MSSRVREKRLRNIEFPAESYKVDAALVERAKWPSKVWDKKGWRPPRDLVSPDSFKPGTPSASGQVVAGAAKPDAATVPLPAVVPPAVEGNSQAVVVGGVPAGPPRPVIPPIVSPGGSPPTSTQPAPVVSAPTAPSPSSPPVAATPGTTNIPLTPGTTLPLPKVEVPLVGDVATPAYNLIKKQLLNVLDSKPFKARSFTLADMKIGEFTGLNVKTRFKILDENDPLIANDSIRRESIRMARATNVPQTWAITGGGIFPSVSLHATIPTGKGPDIVLGFSTGAGIDYSLIAPYAHDANLTVDVLKKQPVALPLTTEAALAMKSGTEVTLTGSGNVAASVGTIMGKRLSGSYGGINISAGASADMGVTVAADAALSFRVKKLEGNKVFVQVSQGYDTERSATVGAGIGGHVTVPDNLPLPTRNLPPGLPVGLFPEGSAVGAINDTLVKLKNLTPEALEYKLNKMMKLDVRADFSKQTSSREIQSYVFDLDNPEAAAAYQSMMRLDFRDVDAKVAAARAGTETGVRAAHYVEQYKASSATVRANAFIVSLLNAAVKNSTLSGTLESDHGDYTYDRADLKRSYSGLITNYFKGARDMKRELVMLKPPIGEVQNYFHMRSEVKGDYITSQDDMRQFLAISDLSGGPADVSAKLLNNPKLLKAFGTTNRIIDVYVTDVGLKHLAEMNHSQLEDAYALYLQTLKHETAPANAGPLWTGRAPWADRDHPNHRKIVKVLNAEIEVGPKSQGTSFAAEYYRLTGGRVLAQDAADYLDCQRWAKMVESLIDKELTPKERAEILVEKADELGFGLDSLGAVAAAVGPENVLVNEMSLEDTSKKNAPIVMHREGQIQDPRGVIDSILNRPD